MAKRFSARTDETYVDGSPVVDGPFGGDDLYPSELRIMRAAAMRKRRSWWRRLFGRRVR